MPIWVDDGPIAASSAQIVYHPHTNPYRVCFELMFLDSDGAWLTGLTYDTLEIAVDQASALSVRPATYRRTNQLTVPRSVLRLSARPERAAISAARCDAYVPSCRGPCLPVAVSIPSTRTTHLSRCLRTVGCPVAFHPMYHLRRIRSADS